MVDYRGLYKVDRYSVERDGSASKTRFIDIATRERAMRRVGGRERNEVGEEEEEEGGKVVPACIFGGTLLPARARDVSTRPTIPTPKCTPDGRLHSCIKKRRGGKKEKEGEKKKDKKRPMLDDILTAPYGV